MAKCSSKLFGYNLECTRRLGYGGLYAEMIHNSRLVRNAAGFYKVEFDGLSGFGQCSERLHLQAGNAYTWKVLGGRQVKIRVLAEHFRYEIAAGEGETGSFTAMHTLENVRFEAVSDAPIRYISLKPQNALYNCRVDVLDAIKALNPTTIRVPGGCYAEADFHWQDGLRPVEERPIIPADGLEFLFSAHEDYDGFELNIDDYAGIARYVGAELEYTVGILQGDPEEAAALVEYCNGGSDTKYGAMRMARGFEQPYGIRTWYVGNEVGFYIDPETAARKYDCFVEAMRRVDPTIRIVAPTGIRDEWDGEFLPRVKTLDLCAKHEYMADWVPDWDLAYVLGKSGDKLLDSLWKARRRCGDRPILLDEWNMRWGTFGDGISGLYAAVIMTMLIRQAETLNLVGASYFALVNEGLIRVYPDHVHLSPDGEVLRRMSFHGEGEIIPCEDRACLKTCHGDHEYISVYNESPDTPKALTGVEGEYEILTLKGDWMDITQGSGELKELPPAAVAFIRKNL